MYAFFESSKQYFLESVNGISWKSEIGISLAQNQKPHEINHAVFDKKTKTSFQRIVAFDKFQKEYHVYVGDVGPQSILTLEIGFGIWLEGGRCSKRYATNKAGMPTWSNQLEQCTMG